MASRPPVTTVVLYPPQDHENLPILELAALVSREELDARVNKTYRKKGICCLCGQDVGNGGHLTRDCTATVLAYTASPIIARRQHRSLFVGEHEICLSHNVFKSCPGCFDAHDCSLCGQPHSAIECHLHRPNQLRAMVLECFRIRVQEYTKRRVEQQRQSRAITGEPRLWQVSVTAERADDQEPDIVHYTTPGLVSTGGDASRLNWPDEDNHRDDYGQQELARLLESFGRDIPAAPDSNRVFALHSNLLLPEGVVNHISGDSFVNACSEGLQDRVRAILIAAGTPPSLRDYKRQKGDDDQALFAQNRAVRESEKVLVNNNPGRYKNDHFIQPDVKNPRQLADGSITLANVHLLLNYPSLHDDRMVLTLKAYSTRLLRDYDLSPPVLRKRTWKGSLGLAVWNRIPIKGDAGTDKRSLRLRQLEGETATLPYPASLVRQYDNHRAQWYLDAAHRGDSKIVVAFGSGQNSFFERLQTLNEESDHPLEAVHWNWTTKALLEDEFGGPSARTTILREELQLLVRPVAAGTEDQPFPNCTPARTQYDVETHNRPEVTVPCLLLHGPSGGIIFLRALHPEATQTGLSDKSRLQAFDYTVNFASRAVRGDLFSNTLAPMFVGSRVDAAKRLETKANSRSRYPSGSQILQYKTMSNKAALLLFLDLENLQRMVRLPGGEKRYIILEHMYEGLHPYVKRSKVLPIDIEGPMRYFGHPDNLVLRAKLTIQSIRGSLSAQQPNSPAQIASAASASRNAQLASGHTIVRLPTAQEQYQAICVCGLVTASVQLDNLTGLPVAVYLDISEGGIHKPNSEKRSGACLSGIPIDDTLREQMKVKIKNGQIKSPTALQKESIAAGLERYHDGTGPGPTTPDDIAEYRRLKEAARLRRAAAVGL